LINPKTRKVGDRLAKWAAKITNPEDTEQQTARNKRSLGKAITIQGYWLTFLAILADALEIMIDSQLGADEELKRILIKTGKLNKTAFSALIEKLETGGPLKLMNSLSDAYGRLPKAKLPPQQKERRLPVHKALPPHPFFKQTA